MEDLSESVRVDVSIKAADKGAADTIVGGLTALRINKELAEVDLPAVSVLEASSSCQAVDCAAPGQESSGATPSSEASSSDISSDATPSSRRVPGFSMNRSRAALTSSVT